MVVTPYKMDQRMMTIRRKSIYEMKPDLLWDAWHGCYNFSDTLCTDDQQVAKWIDRRQGVEISYGFGSGRPYWYRYGMNDQPSLLFDGTDRLEVASVATSLLGATEHTVLVLAKPIDYSLFRVALAFSNTGDATQYLQFGLDTSGRMVTRGAASATVEGTRNVDTTTADSHVFIYTHSSPSAWAHFLDGEEKTLENAHAGGNTGRTFSGITGLNKSAVGYSSGTVAFYGYISLIAVWGQAI